MKPKNLSQNLTFFAFIYKISFVFYSTPYKHEKSMERSWGSSGKISQKIWDKDY